MFHAQERTVSLSLNIAVLTPFLRQRLSLSERWQTTRPLILRFLRVAFLACLFLTFPSARAFDAPAFQGDVLDEAGIFSEAERDTLLQRIKELRENSDIWAAVYVAKSLQGESIEGGAVDTFEKWKLGQKGKDNGVLVLVVPSERKVRIEVGYGLEGFITDVFSRRVIDDIYKPAFRDQRFADGLLEGFDAMARAKSGEIPATENPAAPDAQTGMDWPVAGRLFGFAFVLNLLPAALYGAAKMYGQRKGRTDGTSLREALHGPVLLFGFLGLVFGLFTGIFGGATPYDPEVVPGIAVVNGIFLLLLSLPMALQVRRFLSASAYQRYRAEERLLRIRRRSNVARKIFGVWFDPAAVSTSKGGSLPEPRSSSDSSSDSDSSSSSGGGSSGGGGASGSW
ncbi:MAG: YgcG family protein [Sulfuricellaceae bacterium]|jgi:uncharacterized protein